MNYSTAQMVSRLGITREALRYYEKADLIRPNRNKENGYRTYSEMDGFNILRIKMMQGFGTPVNEIDQHFHGKSLQDQDDYLRGVEDRLTAQIEELQEHLRRVQRNRMFVSDAMQTGSEVSRFDAGEMYKIPMLCSNKDILLPEYDAGLISSWISFIPMVEIGWHIYLREYIPLLENNSDGDEIILTPVICLEAMPYCVDACHLYIEPPVVCFPAGMSLRIMIRTDDPFHIPASQISPLFVYAKEHGYHIISDASGRYSGSERIGDKVYYYFSVRVLIDHSS